MIKVGIIGGSGLDDPKLLKNSEQVEVKTPYGRPSSALTLGKIKGVEVVMLSRHGPMHTLMPSAIPFRANTHALKNAGVTHILATSACGSLREEIKPGHLVFPDQFIDRTTRRESTFYEGPKVYHTAMAEPFCERLRSIMHDTAADLGLEHHRKGTVVTIEGPRFSTKAESNMFRQWKADVVNMSTVPEVVLAREAGLCYALIAMSTDYDCWREGTEAVTWDAVMRVMRQHAENVKKLIVEAIPKIKYEKCSCRGAPEAAVMK